VLRSCSLTSLFIFKPTGPLQHRGIQLPFLEPITTVTTSDVELENTEIPVKLGLRFAIESRRFANGLDIPEIETKPVLSKEEVTSLP
jgi:hypothetical protein